MYLQLFVGLEHYFSDNGNFKEVLVQKNESKRTFEIFFRPTPDETDNLA